MSGEFDCEAYGPEGREVGATCFVGDASGMRCISAAVCRDQMTSARRRVWERIQAGAEAGDETSVFLAGEFSGPEELLGGQPEVSNLETSSVADVLADRLVLKPGEVGDSGGSGPGRLT